MSHIDKAGQNPGNGLPEPRAKHGKHSKPETLTSHVVDVVEGKERNYSGLSLIAAFLMIVFAGIHGIMSVFNAFCPDPAKGSCSRVPLGEFFGVFEIVFFVLAILAVIVTMLLAVEGIARQQRQPLAYSSLILIALSILFFVSGLYQEIIEKIVLRFMV